MATDMQIVFFFGLCLLLIPSISSHKSTGSDPVELEQKILETQENILKEIRETRFYQYITVEFYESGRVKQITRSSDWIIILSLGVLGVAVGGPTLYFVGPANIINLMKSTMLNSDVPMIAKLII